MGFKVVTKKQNGQDVIVGWVPEEAELVQGATLHPQIFESEACPEPSVDVRKFIDQHPRRSFDLHKYENGEIKCRTVSELSESQFIEWTYNWAPAVEEPEIVEESE